MRRIALPLFLAFSLGCAVPSASAQDEPGVHADPDSPAGKEYAIPVEKARRDAGGASEDGGSAQDPALFGAGLTRRGENGGGYSGSASSSDGEGGESGEDDEELAAASGSGGGDDGSSAAPLIGLAVILLGLALGFGLRRLDRSEPGHQASA